MIIIICIEIKSHSGTHVVRRLSAVAAHCAVYHAYKDIVHRFSYEVWLLCDDACSLSVSSHLCAETTVQLLYMNVESCESESSIRYVHSFFG